MAVKSENRRAAETSVYSCRKKRERGKMYCMSPSGIFQL